LPHVTVERRHCWQAMRSIGIASSATWKKVMLPPGKISADAHGPGYLQTSAHPQVVATIDLMFRKIFELWWFDKRLVEMDSICFWRWLWWFLFIWHLNKYWPLLQDDNCNCATPLSLLVIVNISVTTTCALY